MIRILRKNLPRLIIALYLTLTVLGTFSLAAVEPLRSLKLTTANPLLENVLDAPDSYFVQQPAEETRVVTRTRGASFSPLRLGFQRVVSPATLPHTGNPFIKSPILSYAKTQYPDLRNAILLKLRI